MDNKEKAMEGNEYSSRKGLSIGAKIVIAVCLLTVLISLLSLITRRMSSENKEYIIGEENDPNALFPFFENGYWGFIDRKGNVVIKPYLDEASDFYNGVAAVAYEGPWTSYGYINNKGEELLSEVPGVYSFSDNVGMVSVGSIVGYIDTTGRWVLPPQYPYYLDDFNQAIPTVCDFREGLAAIRSKTNKYGFIDKSGNVVIKPQYVEANSFFDGLAAVAVMRGEKKRWGYVSKDGTLIIEPCYEEAGNFIEGLAPAKSPKSHLWGYINLKGNWAIMPQFVEAQDFSEGLAFVQKEYGICGYINKSGTLEIEVTSAECIARPFHNGYAVVSVSRFHDEFIDRKGNTLKTTREILLAGDFHNGLARVLLKPDKPSEEYDCVASYVSDTRPAYINTKGDIVWVGIREDYLEWVSTPLILGCIEY